MRHIHLSKERGGGYQRIEIDTFPEQNLLSLKVFVDTKDAMGANMLNTILEAITAHLKNEFPDKEVLMSILSNHATASVVKVQGEIDVKDLNRGEKWRRRSLSNGTCIGTSTS